MPTLTGLSREDRALIAYIEASGVPHRVTTTTNHPQSTNAGYTSRHVMAGTDGKGLAIDVAGARAGRDTQALADIFNAFLRVEGRLHELIYAGPQVSFNIKDGRRVRKYAVADHHDHVHVSVDRGVFLAWPDGPAPAPAPIPEEEDMAADPEVLKRFDALITATTAVKDALVRIDNRLTNVEDTVQRWGRKNGYDKTKPPIPERSETLTVLDKIAAKP